MKKISLLLMAICVLVSDCGEKSSPQTSEEWLRQGKSYYEAKDYENAITAYTKVLEIKENSVEEYNCLGLVYQELTDYASAEDCYNKAIWLNPNNQEAYCN